MFSSMLHYHFTLHWEGTVQQELWLNNRFHDDIYVGRKLLLSSPPSPPPHPSVHCFTKILKFLCSDLLLPSLAFTPFSSVITGIFIFTPLQSFLRFKMPARRYRKSFGPKKKLPFYFLANKKQIQDRVLRKIWLTKQELLNHKAAEAFSPTLPPQTHTATPSTQTFFVHTPPNHSSEQKPTIPEGGREEGSRGGGGINAPSHLNPPSRTAGEEEIFYLTRFLSPKSTDGGAPPPSNFLFPDGWKDRGETRAVEYILREAFFSSCSYLFFFQRIWLFKRRITRKKRFGE